jgi:hypothetical protein
MLPQPMLLRRIALPREAIIAAGAAASLTAVLLWAGPPGVDLAAHLYQRTLFLKHGFVLWNNFWYAGRYSFVTYSVLYYPLAGLVGIKVLALASIATAALAFAMVLEHEWGKTARASSLSFAVVWAGTALSAAFPFALGAALALLALWALQAGRRGRFVLLALLTLAASPLAFIILAVVLIAIGIARHDDPSRLVLPAVVVCGAALGEFLLFRIFPAEGRFPFSTAELVPALVFCLLGVAVTWKLEHARPLVFFFVVYLAACIAAFAVPSELGENIERVRFAALPLAVLALSLRKWRPLWLAVPAVALAAAWNVTPLAANFTHSRSDSSDAQASYWSPAITYLHRHLTPSYRVEAVDTLGHWSAVYLPDARIPLARGWYRQDDFPQNDVLYGKLGRTAYLAWLRRLAVRYVVLTDSVPDYSARAEAALLRSGKSGLRPVLRTRHVTIFAVPDPSALVTGTHPATVTQLGDTNMTLALGGPGTYRVAVRYSPYWSAAKACLSEGKDEMLRLTTTSAGTVHLAFKVGAVRALETLVGSGAADCNG